MQSHQPLRVQDQSPLDEVFQFSHVSGPQIGQKFRQRVSVQLGSLAESEPSGSPAYEVMNQAGNVLSPHAQRRHS